MQPSRILLKQVLMFLAVALLTLVQSARADHRPGHTKGGGGSNDGSSAPQYVVTDLGSAGTRAVALNNLGGVLASYPGGNNLVELNPVGEIVQVVPLPSLGKANTTAGDINDSFEVAGSVWDHEAFNEQGVVWRVANTGEVSAVSLSAPSVPNGYLSTTRAIGISEQNGLVVGEALYHNSETNDRFGEAIVWQIGANNQVVGFVLPSGRSAEDVNSSGVVIGEMQNGVRAVWYLDSDESGAIIGSSDPAPLPGLGGWVNWLTEITDGGQISGGASTNDGVTHAVIWTVNGNGEIVGPQDLGIPDRHDQSGTTGINDEGQAVLLGSTRKSNGTGGLISSDSAPYLLHEGSIFDLNKLLVAKDGLSELDDVSDINDLGWVCGKGNVFGKHSLESENAYVAIPVP